MPSHSADPQVIRSRRCRGPGSGPPRATDLLRSENGQNTFEPGNPIAPLTWAFRVFYHPHEGEGGSCRKRGRKPVPKLRSSFRTLILAVGGGSSTPCQGLGVPPDRLRPDW